MSATPLRRARAPVILSLTPLIDVVFILLVFFMLASQMADWRQLEIMPQARAGQGAAEREAVVVAFDADGRVRVDGDAAQDIAAAAALAVQRGNGRDILVRPQEATPIQHVVDLIGALSAHGASDVRIEAGAEGSS